MRNARIAPGVVRRNRQRAALLGALAATTFLLTACDIPTEVPEWDTRWVVPATNTVISLDSLLPAGMEVTDGGDLYSVEVADYSFSRTLSDFCPVCPALAGQPFPKPAFRSEYGESTTLPEDVGSITVQEGTWSLTVYNGFSFDPLRPGAGATGMIRFSLLDGGPDGRELDTVVLDGVTTAFPEGTSVELTLSVENETVGPTLTVVMEIDSPAGDLTTLDPSDPIDVDVRPGTVLVSSAEVQVAGRYVSIDPISLDVESIDQGIVDRVEAGAFDLEITNPTGAAMDVDLMIAGPSFADINKPLSVGTGTTRQRVELTRDELQSFLGQAGVTVTGDAQVSAATPSITLTPGQEVAIDARLDLTLVLGG